MEPELSKYKVPQAQVKFIEINKKKKKAEAAESEEEDDRWNSKNDMN